MVVDVVVVVVVGVVVVVVVVGVVVVGFSVSGALRIIPGRSFASTIIHKALK